MGRDNHSVTVDPSSCRVGEGEENKALVANAADCARAAAHQSDEVDGIHHDST